MASIQGAANEQVFAVKKWLGLNENPDGDTRLKLGEASKMVNWKITRDGNLKRRPGLQLVADVNPDGTQNRDMVRGMWSGYVGGRERFVVACKGTLWSLYDGDFVRDVVTFDNLTYSMSKRVSMIPFDNKLYVLMGDGEHGTYVSWDGESNSVESVEGYRPLVAIAIGPIVDVGGELVGGESGELTGEYVNRLNGLRRVWLSPDGENGNFKLPEDNLTSIDWVRSLKDLSDIPYTYDLVAGTISLNTIPEQSVNSIEVAYTKGTGFRDQVAGNQFAELYSGTTDTRIFLYGDGTNRAIYSGMDYDGQPRADYFPDQYEVRVGDSNTPITGMIRHYGSLATFKTNESWSLQHGVVELADENLTPAIYSTPVNKSIGNVAAGQVQLVENSPVSAFGHEIYQWTNSSYYTSNLTRDERQARRISDRIQKTLAGFNLETALMYDDNDHQEFYIVDRDSQTALVLNYATNTWYKYTNFDAVCMCSFRGELYIGSSDGFVYRLTYDVDTDNGTPITAEWESGAIDFGAGHLRKYSSMMWVGLKPEEGTSVDVCVETDRKNTFRDKVVSSTKAKIPGEPFMVKTKIKAKKFVYYRLKLSVQDEQPAVTVTDVEIRVRSTGYAK